MQKASHVSFLSKCISTVWKLCSLVQQHLTDDDAETNPMSLENVAKEMFMGKVKGKLSLFASFFSVSFSCAVLALASYAIVKNISN